MADETLSRNDMIDEIVMLSHPTREEAPLLRGRLLGLEGHQLVSLYSGLKHLSETGATLIQSGAAVPVRDQATNARRFIEQADEAVARFSEATKRWPASTQQKPLKTTKPR